MRILSQDSYTEKYDIPYENVAITYSKYMEGRWRICAQGLSFGINPNENFVQIAEYSSQQKVERAMDMLQEEWRDCGECGAFQFPKDSEVKV